MLRSAGAWLLAAVLCVVGSNAYRQMLGEFRDSEPGSLLFGVLQLVIGTSAIVAAVGVVRRKPRAAWAIGISGLAAAALLVAQPVFEPMPLDAVRSIWLGAGLVGLVSAGMAWCARRLARKPSGHGTAAATSPDAFDSQGLLREGQQYAQEVSARQGVSHTSPDRPPPSARS